MKRTIEKLHQERREKEESFERTVEDLKSKARPAALPAEKSLDESLRRLTETVRAKKSLAEKVKGALQPPGRNAQKEAEAQNAVHELMLSSLQDMRLVLQQGFERVEEHVRSLAGLLSLNAELTDAKDKEWDALGSNHVGMIFKSMEWRVDNLAAVTEDAKILMKKFLLLEDQMSRMLAVLEEKNLPTAGAVKELLEPLEEWRYAGFENRFRGYEEFVRQQQRAYVSYFKQGGLVLDLGCGRGEFMELLKENGIRAEGVDLSGPMVDACLAKGLDCRRRDLFEELASRPDNSLAGLFASQVIEHLPAASLKELIALARQKLAPSGVLLLETVNPLSLFALVNIYFLDLTHRTPVHPQALKFLMETAGFEPVEVRYSAPLAKERLQALPGADEASSILNRNIDALNDLLYAPPNYAVIGTKR